MSELISRAWDFADKDPVFPGKLSKLMPKELWTPRDTSVWISGIAGWRAIITDEKVQFGPQLDFFEEQYDATKAMFAIAMGIRENGQGIIRDTNKEKSVFEDAYYKFFPDESYIGQSQVHELYICLVIEPAVMLGNYLIATGKIKDNSEMTEL